MKFLLIIALFAISLTGFGQTKQDSIPPLTKEVIYNDVKDVLKSLGETLKVGTEHVYEVLVKQQIVHSITNIIVYLFFSVIISILFYKGSKLIGRQELIGKNSDYYTNKQAEENISWLMIPGVIISILFLAFFFFTIRSTVTGFVNPEYGAIEKIISLIKR